ncbi:hypothetical protein GCM10027343_12210 [Noviherbaspirillum agri]
MTDVSNNTRRQQAPGAVSLFFNPTYQLLSLVVILLLGMWVSILIYLQSARENLTDNAVRDGGNLSRAFAEQVRASVLGIDLSLLSLRDEWDQHPDRFHDAVLRQHNYFLREASFQLAVIDANGKIVYSNLTRHPGSVSVADRAYFQSHRDGKQDRLIISEPVIERLSDRLSIQFTRPILGSDGRLRGVVMLSVAPEYFSRFYVGAESHQSDFVALVRSTGEILAPPFKPHQQPGMRLTGRPFLAADSGNAGNYRDKAQTDGIERIFSWRRVDGFDLVVVVADAVEGVLAPYYKQRRILLLGGAFATASLAVFALILLMRLRARTHIAMQSSEERNRLRMAALEAVGNAVVVTNANAEIEWVNHAFEDLTGYSREEAFGRRPAELVSSGLQPREFYRHMWQTILDGRTWRGELVNRRKDGSLYDEELVIAPVKSPTGAITHFVGVKQDISERKRNENALQQSHDMLAKLSAQVPGVIYQYRLYPDGRSSMPFASQSLGDIYEISPEQVRDDASLISARNHPDDADGITASILKSARTLEPWHHEYRVVLPVRGVRWLLSNARPERLEDGSTLWHGAVTDITERKLADENLRIAAAAFNVQEGMMITDAHGRILRVNRAFEELTGYRAEEVIGKTPAVLKSGRQGPDFYNRMWQVIEQQGYWEGEIWNRRKSGELYPEWLVITAVKDSRQRITHYVSAFSDITIRKEAEAQIRNLAFFDPLTGLPNRRLLMDRVTQALAASARNGRHGALMLIDLDHFKTLNDTLGHDVGDQLLIQVAQRLSASVRECDTVARLGGDEFVVMLQDLSGEGTAAATQIRTVAAKILATLNEPYELAGGEYGHRNTPSIGISQFQGHDEPFDVLLKQADIALYQAKDAGRNTARFYSVEMQSALNEKALLEAGLREALASGGFQLYYQAQVDDRHDIVAAEALLRWHPPGQPPVPPAKFIELAEETGLILQIGQWVLETACVQLAAWSALPETRHLAISVNVSAKQFRQPGFVEMVRTALEKSGAHATRLKLELTESMIIGDIETTIGKMHELRALGVTFALDDFGTGYSSLSYLKRLPLDQVKIDRSFVRDIATDAGDAAIVQTIINMSHTLQLQVIAEGVETHEQLAFLTANKCRNFQGYLFGRPMPPDAFLGMLAVNDDSVEDASAGAL